MKIKKYNTVLGASARIFFHTYKFIVKTISVTTHIDICIFCCSFGASWIYPMINWNKPGPTIGVVIGSAVGLIVLHVILVGITVTRKKLTQRFERKHTHGNTHTRTHPHAHTDTDSQIAHIVNIIIIHIMLLLYITYTYHSNCVPLDLGL